MIIPSMVLDWLNRDEYPFKSNYYDTEFGRIHYVDEGQGDPIVFFHGNPAWSYQFRYLIQDLSRDHRCIAHDMIGFGLSDKPDNFSYLPKDHLELIDEFLENPMYQGLTGGRVISFSELKGFISLEFYSWWILLAGLFLAYISVASLSNDFEGKRMDLIFSTPIKREHYLIEKFAALSAITFVIVLFAAGALAGGIESIGYGHEADSYTIFLSLIGSLPMLLVIMAIGFLSALQFKSTRVGMGIAFLFIMVQFILYTLAGMSSVYESAKYVTVMNYWDYNSVLFDGLFNAGHFVGLFVVALIILMLAVYVFKKQDIPA